MTTRRRFLAFLGSLAPGLALARAGMGAPGPLIEVAFMLRALGPADLEWHNEGAAAAEWERMQATPQRPGRLTPVEELRRRTRLPRRAGPIV